MKNEESASASRGRLARATRAAAILLSSFFILSFFNFSIFHSFNFSSFQFSNFSPFHSFNFSPFQFFNFSPFHYRNLDSLKYCCDTLSRQPLSAGDRAQLLNHQAFYHIAKMEYDEAERLLNQIPDITDNQIELLVGYVQQMRLCQRRSRNREFYEYRERALSAQQRINEELADLTPQQQQRLLYAESELAIVSSTYYYYVGLERQSADALLVLSADRLKADTAQYLNYLYNIGAGGILTQGSHADILQQEMDCLLRCFQIAREHDYPYFAANAMEAMAEHLAAPADRSLLMEERAAGLQLVNPEGVDDDLLPVWLADNALATFREYGDVYQVAGAYRTLATCYREQGDYESALFNLDQALADSVIQQAPDLVASIYEQLSVAYAAVNDKLSSDRYRNLYLDLQEQTRQDRQLEARADQYERTAAQLNWMLLAVVAAIVVLLFALWLFNHLNRRQERSANTSLDDLLEQRQEELAVSRLHLQTAERTNLDQRAKLSLVNGITPLIDRMLHEIRRLGDTTATTADATAATPSVDSQRLDYVRELTAQINADNDVLTHWIQLRQGALSLHIESFPVQPLFDIVVKSRMGFQLRQVELLLSPTTAVVKADRILTLFMLNTLADNARKFTPAGGRVHIYATETDSYVELSVSDTGVGMTDEQLAHIFDRQAIADERHVPSGGAEQSHGFGLLNCKGIIDKYHKLSQIFAVCTLQAESRLGQGSRFFFRLPRGVVRLLLPLLLLLPAAGGRAQELSALDRASIYADSAYFSNINGTYQRTLVFVDSCQHYLNQHYAAQRPGGTRFLKLFDDQSPTPAEIEWFHDSVASNYDIILDMRNECAVAALSLHEWQLYAYNNRIYTQLFKELSADTRLEDYCRNMQQSQTNKRVAVALLILLALSILPAYYLLYYRHRLYRRFMQDQSLRARVDALTDELHRTDMELSQAYVSNAVLDNCLSALKHETMYYPSRISQLADAGDPRQLDEVTTYYRELYGLLSQQAMRQTDRVRLHLRPLDHGILGDETLIAYLFEILQKQAGPAPLDVDYQPQPPGYVRCTVLLPALRLTARQAERLFTPSVANIPFLLCRQIVRDHGEATGRRACSIRAELSPPAEVPPSGELSSSAELPPSGELSPPGITRIVITLPGKRMKK